MLKSKKVIAMTLAGALVLGAGAVVGETTQSEAAMVKKKGYTLSKKPGTYKKAVKVKIKAKKGYKVYYSTNGKFKLSKVVKSKKKKTIKIKKTKTLYIYCVKNK